MSHPLKVINEEEKPWYRNQKIDRDHNPLERDGPKSQRPQKLIVHFKANAIKYGKEREPKKENVEATAQKREGRSEQSESNNGGPKEQVDLCVVEDPQNITSRELRIRKVHSRTIVADPPPHRKIGSQKEWARFAFSSSAYAKSPRYEFRA